MAPGEGGRGAGMSIRMDAVYRVIASIGLTLVGGCNDRPAPLSPGPIVHEQTIHFDPAAPQLQAIAVEIPAAAPPAVHRLMGRLVWDEDRTVRIYTPFTGRV